MHNGYKLVNKGNIVTKERFKSMESQRNELQSTIDEIRDFLAKAEIEAKNNKEEIATLKNSNFSLLEKGVSSEELANTYLKDIEKKEAEIKKKDEGLDKLKNLIYYEASYVYQELKNTNKGVGLEYFDKLFKAKNINNSFRNDNNSIFDEFERMRLVSKVVKKNGTLYSFTEFGYIFGYSLEIGITKTLSINPKNGIYKAMGI